MQATRQQLADLLGVTPNHITKLMEQGLPCAQVGGGRGKPSQFDVVACLAWWRERQAATDADSGTSAREAYLQALTARVQQDIAVRAGELVSRDEVILAGQGYTKAWTAKVRALPRRAVQEGVIQPKQEAALTRLCRELLTEIAGWKTVADTKGSVA